MPTNFTPDQRSAYQRDGFVMVRSLFDVEEIGILREAIERDPQLRESLYDRKDSEGDRKSTRLNSSHQ